MKCWILIGQIDIDMIGCGQLFLYNDLSQARSHSEFNTEENAAVKDT